MTENSASKGELNPEVTRVLFVDENQGTTTVELPWNSDRTGPDQKALEAMCEAMGVDRVGELIILPKDTKIDYLLFLDEKEQSGAANSTTTTNAIAAPAVRE